MMSQVAEQTESGQDSTFQLAAGESTFPRRCLITSRLAYTYTYIMSIVLDQDMLEE